MNLVLGLVSVTVFTMMLTIGVNHSLEQLTSLWHKRDMVLRGLLSVLVLVPAVVFVLLLLFNLPPAVATGMALLAASPGAPMTTKRSQMVGADTEYITSLQLTLALSAIVVTPVILAVFYTVFDLVTEPVSPLYVAKQIAQVTLLPVIIGLLLRHFAPKFTEKFSNPLTLIANVLFIGMALSVIVILVIAPDFRASLLVGWGAAAVILVTALSAVIFGHALGGPRLDQRAGLAIASLARNIGLALFIAGLSEHGNAAIPTILAYLIIGLCVQVIYTVWLKRQES